MANFEGGENANPGSYSTTETLSTGVSVPGGVRTAVIMGEGLKSEILVSSAQGGGRDGFNSSYSSSSGADGRHFVLANAPIISNRTTLYKNGIPLVGLEQAFNSSSGTFSSLYDYRINITNGRIELQTSSLLDQGGTYYTASQLNVGNGVINDLTLDDENAPTETWKIKCISAIRDGYGDPIDGYSRFIAQGTVSGTLLDGYGNPVVWTSNDTVVSNGILSFSIDDGATVFREGDTFTVKVKGGALVRGDSLSVTYIAEADINDPQFFTDPGTFQAKHGLPSLDNYLAIGAQLAFANATPGIWACQCAPPVPRRVSYTVEAEASGSATADDLKFSLPLNVVPDVDYNVNFFIYDPNTETESQIIPNKVDFYDPTYTTTPGSFMFGSLAYSYTVILEDAVVKDGDDGVLTSVGPTTGTISSTTVTFDSSHVGKTLKILTPEAQAGEYTITSVSGGVATFTDGVTAITAETEVEFQVVDDTLQTAAILLTDDLALAAGQQLRVTVIDTKDSTFFDAGWINAYESLEAINTNIVVPLPKQTISTIFQNGRNHVISMSNVKNKKERMLFVGAIAGLTPDNVTGVEEAAVEDIGVLEGIQGDTVTEVLAGDVEDLADYSVPNAYGGTYRVVYHYPDEIVVSVGGTNTTLDGFFISAAHAGFLCGVPFIGQPSTRKVLSGFTILRSKLYRPSVLESLSAAGICVLQPVAGGGKIVWGKTTTQSGFPEEEEISIVFIRDRIAQALRDGTETFAGTAEDDGLLGSLIVRADKIMKGLRSQKIITRYKNLRVIQNTVDARQFDISVQARPTYAVNWIYSRIQIGNI